MATKTCTSVTLRQRPYKSGRISLYLDYYPPIRNPETMKMSRREYLGLYLISKPRSAAERDYNADILQKAEAIRNLRFNSIFNEQFGFVDHVKEQADFIAWFKQLADKKKDKWASAFKHFSNFVSGKCCFGELTVDLCSRFSEYLLEEAIELRHGKEKLSRNSAAAFYCTFRAALKLAYKTKKLNENINDYLDSIKTEDVEKEFLTLDEVKALVATPVADKYVDLNSATL